MFLICFGKTFDQSKTLFSLFTFFRVLLSFPPANLLIYSFNPVRGKNLRSRLHPIRFHRHLPLPTIFFNIDCGVDENKNARRKDRVIESFDADHLYYSGRAARWSTKVVGIGEHRFPSSSVAESVRIAFLQAMFRKCAEGL